MRQGARWAIVLAGGEGTRLRDFTISRFGEARPKQYCAFLGDKTMLDHTLERAQAVVGARRMVTVIGRGHGRYLDGRSAPPGFMVEQPRNCDTAAGILLPLATVMAYDPNATVMIFPSDHYVRPGDLFVERMNVIANCAERMPDRLIMAAAVADEPETEYGWIQPGDAASGLGEVELFEVRRFHEKPGAAQARDFHAAGYLWNTFIMAGRAATIWDMTSALHPGLAERFDLLRRVVGRPEEAAVLGAIYESMPTINFSREVLERAHGRALVAPLAGIEWNDWGRPERILATLDGLRPAASPVSMPAYAGAAI